MNLKTKAKFAITFFYSSTAFLIACSLVLFYYENIDAAVLFLASCIIAGIAYFYCMHIGKLLWEKKHQEQEREHFKNEEELKKKISEAFYKALTTKMTMDELTDEVWGIIDKAEKVIR